ncbi:hypothetical protein KAU40_01290 [Candidatus Parcubacteria bacterium]|nr:hypothetical protein [Candidatus Parcubacteria bacterium]
MGIIEEKGLDKLMEEMERIEKEKPVIPDQEMKKRIGKLQQIRALLSKVEDGIIRLEEMSITRESPEVEIEGKKVKCLSEFYFSIAESNQRVGDDGLWNKELSDVFLDDTVTKGNKWVNIRFAPTNENQSVFICEIYSRTFPISDEDLVELLSVVPIEGGTVIDNFETFERYVQWFIKKYIKDKKQLQTEEEKKDNVFQRILNR